jgi:RHS repeat-associated protein
VGYLYDGPQAIAELQGNALGAVYHTGLAIDEVLARYTPSRNRYLIADALGSVIAETDEQAAIKTTYAYSPYGEVKQTGDDGDSSLQYTGRENDGTGLYYYRARYYDPQLKRFISVDPIGLEGGINVYTYVNGNPVGLVDPLGLAPDPTCVAACTVAGGLVGGGVGYVGGGAAGGLAGGIGGTLVAPGVGTLGGGGAGAAMGSQAGGAFGAAAGAAAGNAAGRAMCPDKPDCHKANKFELLQAGITDAHKYKKEHGAVPESHYDICKCKDGSIRIAKVHMCGKTSDFWD